MTTDDIMSEERIRYRANAPLGDLATLVKLLEHQQQRPSHPTATELLVDAADVLDQRGTMRDAPSGERSMPRAVSGFNAITGRDLDDVEGWIFMLQIKLSRAMQGQFHADDWLDLIGYAALAAEAAHIEHHADMEGSE
jgi:hypothetical protein